MTVIDLVDETFIRAPLQVVTDAVHEDTRWPVWWPDLTLTVFQDRGSKGIRWSVTGGLVGSMEVWLEPYREGVILHHYLRADPVDDQGDTEPAVVSGRRAAALLHTRQRGAKRIFWALKDELE